MIDVVFSSGLFNELANGAIICFSFNTVLIIFGAVGLKLTSSMFSCFYFRFRVLFVHLIPCVSLVILNILLFRYQPFLLHKAVGIPFSLHRTMKQAEQKRERLLNCKQKAVRGESKESSKLRDSNCTTLMLIVVITVRKIKVFSYYIVM